MIEVRNLTKQYGTEKAVDGLSFTIPKGQILGFLGPNGAGKTTTMKMLTCFMPPTEGEAFVDGLDVQKDALAIRQRLGYLPEQNPLYEDMLVYDYLAYVAEMRGVPKNETAGRVAEYASRCGLEEVLSKPIQTLSKGFKQRVGLAQALLHDPDVLILDEPTSGLDPNQKGEILGLIRALGEEKTVIFSTHILSEVEAVCERVLIIHKGQLVADGSIADLRNTFSGGQKLVLGLMQADVVTARETLAAIKGLEISAEEQVSDTEVRLMLSVSGMEDVRPALFRLAVAQNWIMTELHREQVNLEDVFRQVTA